MPEMMSRTRAIKTFFESDPHGRKVTMDELKALGAEDRDELGRLSAAALGAEIEDKKA